MTEEAAENLEAAIGTDRRTFIKRLVVGTVFAAPIVSSFSMSGIEAAFGSSPRSTALVSNANTTPQYPQTVQCFVVNPNVNFDFTFQDTAPPIPSPPVTLRLQVPFTSGGQHALPNGTTICVYRGDLTALAPLFPGQTPLSAYSVKWDTPTLRNPPPFTNDPHQNAVAPLTLTVTTGAVQSGNPIYVVDSGTPVDAGSTAGAGTWQVTFVTDPNFVVATQVVPPTTPASSVTVEPRFTG